MSDEQRNRGQICSSNTDVFKENKIEIITNIQPQTIHLTTIKNKSCCTNYICCTKYLCCTNYICCKNFYKNKLTSQMQVMLLLFVYVIICSLLYMV